MPCTPPRTDSHLCVVFTLVGVDDVALVVQAQSIQLFAHMGHLGTQVLGGSKQKH
jgi:hypothetical protein